MENKEDKEDKKEDVKEEENDVNKEVEEPVKVDEQDKKENKQLKKIFFIIGVLALFFLGIFFINTSQNSFEHQGVTFHIDKQTIAGKTIYQTSLPVGPDKKITTGQVVFADYNFYLRKDPRTLRDLPVEGEITLMRNLVINFTGDVMCDGYGMIAVGNLQAVLGVLGVEMIKDETAGCDPDGRYTFLQLQTADETSIEQFGPSCYNLNVNNCEVLEVTEKYIVELLSEVTKNRLS